MYRGALISVRFEKVGGCWSWKATTNRDLGCFGDGFATFEEAVLVAANECNDLVGSKGRWRRRPDCEKSRLNR
jgi:hypothetical protein